MNLDFLVIPVVLLWFSSLAFVTVSVYSATNKQNP